LGYYKDFHKITKGLIYIPNIKCEVCGTIKKEKEIMKSLDKITCHECYLKESYRVYKAYLDELELQEYYRKKYKLK